MDEKRKKEIAALLPVEIRPEVLREAIKINLESDLGGNKIIYSRVSYEESGWDGFTGAFFDKSRRTWAACCRCTACGNSFESGWISPKNPNGEKRGIAALVDTDGDIIDGVPLDNNSENYDIVKYYDGESLNCPHCGKAGILTHKSQMRGYDGNNLKYKLLVGSVENLDNLTTVVFWEVTREFSMESLNLRAVPKSALIIPENYNQKGGLLLSRYVASWENVDGVYKDVFAWDTPKAGRADPCQALYYSRERGLKYGAWCDGVNVPNQKGKSGEKTGLIDYLKAGGRFPMMYLTGYREFKSVENLIKAGWTSPIESAIDKAVHNAVNAGKKLKSPYHALCCFHLDAKRPRDMLCMTRDEVRIGAAWKWDDQALLTWYSFVNNGYAVPGDAAQMNLYFNAYGADLMREYLNFILESGRFIWIKKIDGYLQKQNKIYPVRLSIRDGMRYFLDYQSMLNEQCQEIGTVPGPDEIFPRDLRAAHDRLAAIQKVKGVAGFDKILAKWGGLEFSDGEFCAKLPVCEADLIREGHILHHCVGSYGKSHVAGRIIIFIRHARRPERSFFTLNENLNGDVPKRIQLHGYRNETLPGGKRLTIPKGVLDFVERWEREILNPVFHQVRREESVKVSV